MQQLRDDGVSSEPTETSLYQLEIELSIFVRRAAAHYLTGHTDEGPLDGWRYPLLVRLAEYGPERPAQLARVFGLNRSTVSRHLGRLEEADLVFRPKERGSATTSPFAITTAGQAALETARRARMGPLRALMAAWPETQRRELAWLLSKLNHDLDARDDGRGPRRSYDA